MRILIQEIGDIEIEEISLSLLKEYLAKEAERLKIKQLRIPYSICAIPISFCFEEGHIARNPSLKLREPKTEKRIPKFLIEEDVRDHEII